MYIWTGNEHVEKLEGCICSATVSASKHDTTVLRSQPGARAGLPVAAAPSACAAGTPTVCCGLPGSASASPGESCAAGGPAPRPGAPRPAGLPLNPRPALPPRSTWEPRLPLHVSTSASCTHPEAPYGPKADRCNPHIGEKHLRLFVINANILEANWLTIYEKQRP